MFYGFNRGRGGRVGGGAGLGFRGSSPPWPYVGRGRGGLPRCSYYFGGAVAPISQPYGTRPFYSGMPSTARYAPYSPQMTREDELNYMKEQAEAIKGQLEEIESRMRDLEAEK
jgi:hypothetical protein